MHVLVEVHLAHRVLYCLEVGAANSCRPMVRFRLKIGLLNYSIYFVLIFDLA